jgi:tetratricopeptide (TPR) repeat protein
MRTVRQQHQARASRPALKSVLAAAAILLATCNGRRGPATAADPGQTLYSQGNCTEALPIMEKAAETAKSGTLLYKIGYCKGAAGGAQAEGRKKLWADARPLLEQEIAAPDGATLERLYYLTVICSDQLQLEPMGKYARQAVDTFEKGPDPNKLTGDDWFRLGRLHDFLQEASEGEAAYRRAVSAYGKTPAANPSYHALALVQVANQEFTDHHYVDAADDYTQALKLVPSLNQVRPFQNGVALLGAGRFDEAVTAFGLDREPKTVTESQYAADIARKAKEAGGLVKADADGTPIDGMPTDGLDARIKEAGKAFRAAREKNSWKPGDTLSAEVATAQRRFISLLRERLLQTGEVQEFCLKEGVADLVRR